MTFYIFYGWIVGHGSGPAAGFVEFMDWGLPWQLVWRGNVHFLMSFHSDKTTIFLSPTSC
jgi:hypothetical protein